MNAFFSYYRSLNFCSLDNAAAGPSAQWTAAAVAAVAAEAQQARPVPPAQDVRAGL